MLDMDLYDEMTREHAIKHFKKAYKLAGMTPPGLNGIKKKKINQND
jgi:hypothetical protein